jgi:cytoskeletal protein CcmA (bactofilin family)
MSDLRIPRGQTATLDRVEGSLRVGNGATVQASNGKTMVVTQGVYFEGSAKVNGNLECDLLECHRGRLEMNGNLTVCKRLDVGHSIQVQGAVKAEDIDVGGKIFAQTVNCNRMRVGGHADIENAFEASSVEVGGKFSAAGLVKIGDLHVGGEVEVGGGSISGHIRVGGKFSSKSAVEFGELLVYGKGFLPAGCKGHRVSTFGKLEVDGNLTCDYIEVGGVVELHGDCHAERVEVGGKFEVNGSVYVSDRLEGYGQIEIGGNFEGSQIRVSGNLEVNQMIVKEEADISGKLETAHGLKAKLVTVRSGSRCEGVLIGERVEVGKSSDLTFGGWGVNWAMRWAAEMATARVDDVYGREVVLGPMCRAERIFAEKVKLEQGSVAEQVTYTAELKVDFGAICEAPKKVDTLPKPPF